MHNAPDKILLFNYKGQNFDIKVYYGFDKIEGFTYYSCYLNDNNAIVLSKFDGDRWRIANKIFRDDLAEILGKLINVNADEILSFIHKGQEFGIKISNSYDKSTDFYYYSFHLNDNNAIVISKFDGERWRIANSILRDDLADILGNLLDAENSNDQ